MADEAVARIAAKTGRSADEARDVARGDEPAAPDDPARRGRARRADAVRRRGARHPRPDHRDRRRSGAEMSTEQVIVDGLADAEGLRERPDRPRPRAARRRADRLGRPTASSTRRISSAQFAQALDNVLAVRHAPRGGTSTDIAEMTIYVTDIAAYRAARKRARRRSGASGWASTSRRWRSSRSPRWSSPRRSSRSRRSRTWSTRHDSRRRRRSRSSSRSGVATITLDRPKRLNALTFEVYRELAETFEQLDRVRRRCARS